MKCIVHNCQNETHQGQFIGQLCYPCYSALVSGNIGPTTSFLGTLKREHDKMAESLDKIHNVLGESRDSDHTELWKVFESQKGLIKRLQETEDRLEEAKRVNAQLFGMSTEDLNGTREIAQNLLSIMREYGQLRVQNDRLVSERLEQKPTKAPKIVQILIGPENNKWQGQMFGLGDDGITYHGQSGQWEQFMPELETPLK